MGFDPALANAVPENVVRFVGHTTHVHEEPHLIHMVLGAGTLSVDGESIRLEPRISVWLDRDVPHALTLDPPAIALGPLLAPQVRPSRRVQVLGAVPAISDLMLARLAAQPHTEAQVDLFTRSLETVLLRLARDDFRAPDPVHPVVARIAHESVLSTATLAQLSARAGITPRHVQRTFRAETGMGFVRWRRRRRLSIAMRALATGTTPAVAARRSLFSSSTSLLRAMSSESGVPFEELREDPVSALSRARDRPAPR